MSPRPEPWLLYSLPLVNHNTSVFSVLQAEQEQWLSRLSWRLSAKPMPATVLQPRRAASTVYLSAPAFGCGVLVLGLPCPPLLSVTCLTRRRLLLPTLRPRSSTDILPAQPAPSPPSSHFSQRHNPPVVRVILIPWAQTKHS